MGGDPPVSGDDDTVLARGPDDGGLNRALVDLRPGGDDDEAFVRAQVLAGMGVVSRSVRLGRYRLGKMLGQGGAGAVFEAEDARLGRRVAVKLVRARVTAAEDASMAQRRLLREARAAARLSHPNVVTVYDVGRYEPGDIEGLGVEVASRGVYIVMELVEGVDLAHWLRRRQPQEAVLALMRAAARGLAAAHGAGLVHRDFKPANVMVCADGTVKVADFGLARSNPSSSSSSNASEDPDYALSILTEAGLVIGTLPYMAPEQQEGDATQASDQYAFCVTLFEALVGRRPFRGKLVESYSAKLTGAIPETPGLPQWIRDVLVRGMSPSPNDRYASMDEVHQALKPPEPTRRRWVWFAGLAIAALLGAALPDERCPSYARYADPMHDAADKGPHLQPHADDVDAAWEQYCRALGKPGPALEARRRCLADGSEQRLHYLELWRVQRLSIVDLERALAQQPPLAECSEVAADPHGPPQAIAREVRAIGVRARGAIVQIDAGRIDLGLADARAALRDAEALGYPAIIAEARFAVAHGEIRRGAFDVGIAELERAYWSASDLDELRTMASAAGMLAFVLGKRRLEFEAALEWERHAEAAVTRLGNPAMPRAELANIRAAIRLAEGKPAEAAALFEVAIASLREAEGDQSLALAVALNNLGEMQSSVGEYALADEALRAAAAIRLERGVDDQPAYAAVLVHQAKNAARQDKTDAAVALNLEALRVLDTAQPKGHPWRAVVLLNLGALYGTAGEYDKAAATFEDAIEQHDREGTRDAGWAGLHKNLALAHQRRERYSDALSHYQLAAPVFPLSDPRRPETLIELAQVSYELAQYDRAGSYLGEALAAAEHAPIAEDFGKRVEDMRALIRRATPE